MKKSALIFLLFFLPLAGFSASQDSLGLEGDNLDLNGVMELFKESNTPEEFEAALNDPSKQVNNLDLNKDNKTDYIKVEDRTEGTGHALVLQALLGPNETQDVAVIELDKKGKDSASVQVVGDEDLYGQNYIVEPVASTSAKVESKERSGTNVFVNVSMWPAVKVIYGPRYRPWKSIAVWSAYPAWFTPWKPVPLPVYIKRVAHHKVHYHRVHHVRHPHIHKFYRPHRVVSVHVHKKGRPHGPKHPGKPRHAKKNAPGPRGKK